MEPTTVTLLTSVMTLLGTILGALISQLQNLTSRKIERDKYAMSQRQGWEEKAFAIAESIASTTSQIDSLCRSRSARDMLIKTLDRGGIMQTKDEDSDPYVEKIKESISRMLAINSELESEFRTLVKVVSQKFGELSLYLDNASHRTSRAFHNAIVDYVARVDSEDAVAVQNEFNYQQDEFRKAMRGHFSIE